MRTRAGPKRLSAPTPHSVKDLLRRGLPDLKRVTVEAQAAERLLAALTAELPAGLAAQVRGVSEREGVLVVFATSAAWAARLRFALTELRGSWCAAHPEVRALEVRVRPGG